MIANDDSPIQRAVELLRREIGLRPDPALISRLHRALRDEAADRHQEPDAYIDGLTADRVARQHLVDRVTVQETSFFRHPGQFAALARHVLPQLPDPISIWSAGCANGQEAYSLAMVLDEQARPGTVFATDVSTRARQRTAAARYAKRELTGLSSSRRARYLVGGPADWEIRQSLRDRVTVEHHNIVTDDLPDRLASCQIVFCRNVLIYFTPEHATAFLTRLADRLAPGAYLFLGYAETIWQVTDLFEPVRIGESFEYHRRRPPIAPAQPAAGQLDGLTRAMVSHPGSRRPPAPRVRRPPRPVNLDETSLDSDSAELSAELARTGQAAANAGDYPSAITAFRKCVYLTPDDPMSHVHLGLTLEASGDRRAAGRAFAAARAALHRVEPSEVLAALGGYRIETLLALLHSREQDPCP